MSAEESKRLARRFYDEVNRGNIGVLDEMVPEDYIQHNPQVAQGREGVRQFLSAFHSAFPDGRSEVEDVVAEGDKVAARWTFRGTHQGEFFGIPATGRQLTIQGMDMWRVANGQLVEHWDAVDNLGMMQQMGVIPPAG